MDVRAFLASRLASTPELAGLVDDLAAAHAVLVECFQGGGKLLLAGNGGSCSDCLHISGELLKSFEAKRPLADELAQQLRNLPLGAELCAGLESGLPAVVLGINGALVTAFINDKDDARQVLAQECLALARPGDVLLGISTSGNAEDVRMAMSVARARGCRLLSLTGTPGGAMAAAADISLRTPGDRTAAVQEYHVKVYHALCASVEAHFFPERKP